MGGGGVKSAYDMLKVSRERNSEVYLGLFHVLKLCLFLTNVFQWQPVYDWIKLSLSTLSLSMFLFLCLCLCLYCLCMHLCPCVCLSLSLSLFHRLFLSVSVSISLYLFLSVCMPQKKNKELHVKSCVEQFDSVYCHAI